MAAPSESPGFAASAAIPAIVVVLGFSGAALFIVLYRVLSAAATRERASRAHAAALAQKSATHALAADLRYQSLFESIPVPICVVDATGRAIATNPAFVTLLGVDSSSQLDQAGALPARIAGVGEFERTIDIITGNGLVENRVWKLRSESDELIVTVHGTQLSEPPGNFQLVLTDITAQRRADTQVVDSKMELEQVRNSTDAKLRDLLEQSMEMAVVRDRAVRLARRRTEILAGLAEELHRQVSPIENTFPLIQNRIPEAQRDLSELLAASTRSLAATVNDLREFSRIENGQVDLATVNFSLRSLIESVADELADKAENRGIELLCLIRPNVPDAVIGDPARLRQIALNLLANAVEHTHAGDVSINVSVARDGASEAIVRFEVEDSGDGIPPDAIPGLFDLAPGVESARGRGTRSGRFGLAMSRHLVERMSGQMGVESEPGQGTLFWFTVKLTKLLTASDTPADLTALRGKRALVVDDAASCRGVLAEILRNWGLVIATAEQAMEAVGLCQTKAAAGEPFDFVLLDYELPGMNGLETAEAILDLQIPVNLILTIPPSLRHWREEPFLHGIQAALSKPVHAGDLYAALIGCVPSPGSEPAESSLVRLGETLIENSGPAPGPHVAPPRDQEVRIAEASAGAPEPESNQLHILLAEDNIVNQRVARRLVEKMGYTVDVVNNGSQAVNAARNGNYSLILMDCQMPEMDGLAATAEIRRFSGPERNVPIVAMTANSMRGDRERCLDAGMNDYVSKPVAFETLHSVLSYWLSHADAIAAKAAAGR